MDASFGFFEPQEIWDQLAEENTRYLDAENVSRGVFP
jgi:hypothetical protein